MLYIIAALGRNVSELSFLPHLQLWYNFLMKNYLPKLLIFLLLISFFIPLKINAVCLPGEICIENPLEADTFWELMENIVRFLFHLSLFVGALMIVVAAYYFLASGGDPAKIKTAKDIIIWTLVGIIILFLSVAFVTFLKEMLGLKSTP